MATKKSETISSTDEAPVLSHLTPFEQHFPGAPGVATQWGSRTIATPHKVELTLRTVATPVRQVLAEAIAGPGYVEFLGSPVTAPPPPPPVMPALALFNGPTTVEQGQPITLIVGLTVPAPSQISVPVIGSGVSGSIPVNAGALTGSGPILIPRTVPTGMLILAASLGGTTISHTFSVTAMPPGPVPPTPVPEGTLGYVAVDAKPNGTGALNDPWPLAAALTGPLSAKLSAGGTVWLGPGVYKAAQLDPEGVGYLMTVFGSPAKPLIFRASPGARSIIDGGLAYWGSSHDVWIQDIEFIVTEPKPTGQSGSNPSPAGSPRGGIHAYSGGAGNKCINCILGAMNDMQGKGNRQGASIWLPSREFELYGCLIVDNGWQGSDRGHGHGAYIQNPPGSYRKYARQNIFLNRNTAFTAGRYMFHIYGNSSQISNITAEGNVCIGPEPSLFSDGYSAATSAGHIVNGNVFVGCRVQVASSPIAPATISNNTWSNGTLEIVGDGSGQIVENNLLVPPSARPPAHYSFQKNAYDENRANLVLIDWPKTGTVKIVLPGWDGKSVQVKDPTNFWGLAIWSGIVPIGGISLPVGPSGAAAYVAVKS